MANLNKQLHEKFLVKLKQRIPERGRLSRFLIDALCIEKEAVYRRLRGEVQFTLAEAAVIARKLHISIDDIFSIAAKYRGYPFRLYGYNFFNMTEADYAIAEQYLSVIRMAVNDPHSEFGYGSRIVPLHFSASYKRIFRLYMLRWLYQFDDPGATLPYAQVVIPARFQAYHDEFTEEVQKVKHTYFVWDDLLMYYMANDIRYFYRIGIMTDEDVALLKEELLQFLKDLESLASKGHYKTGNKVEIYVSNLNFEATYTYLYSENVQLSMMTAFSLSALTSLEAEACERMRTWIHSLKRTSTLISTCSEIDKAHFFKKQRDYLDEI